MADQEFEKILSELGTLKPPGVSGSRIKHLKDLFVSHVDEEAKLVSILINSCTSTPVSNKLGPLYVLDAVVRALIEELGTSVVDEKSPEGTAAHAIFQIRSNIERLLDDIIPNSNEDVKDRISKLIEIWVNCSTFDKDILDRIKDKYYKTFTPPGTPPKKKVTFTEPPVSNSTSTSATATSSNVASKDPTSVLAALANLAKNNTPSPNGAKPAKLASSTPPSSAADVSNTNDLSNPNAIFQLLQNMNKSAPPPAAPAAMKSNAPNLVSNDTYRDRSDRNDKSRSSDRQRDRSPDRSLGGSRPNSQPIHDHDGERNEPSNPHFRPKRARIDNSIPPDCINVYSRTVFIGGVPPHMTDIQLVNTLRPYAEVQSCIINTARKHAFVKVYSRAEAEQIIQAFSVSHASGLRARWGVGFGPRDCCNYQTGVSTIPIQRLTDADRKWIVQAEWGGTTPDLELQPGLFIEEPDIEVGHGISSKSISKKMPTNSSHNGPKSDAQRQQMNFNRGYNNQPPFGYPPQPNMMYPPQGMPPMNGMPPQYGFPQQGGMPPPPMNGIPPMNGMPPMPNGMPAMPPPGMNGGMDQAAMMQAMMQAMQSMQQNPGTPQSQGSPDMNNMMQVMANMMGAQGQPPQQPPSSH